MCLNMVKKKYGVVQSEICAHKYLMRLLKKTHPKKRARCGKRNIVLTPQGQRRRMLMGIGIKFIAPWTSLWVLMRRATEIWETVMLILNSAPHKSTCSIK